MSKRKSLRRRLSLNRDVGFALLALLLGLSLLGAGARQFRIARQALLGDEFALALGDSFFTLEQPGGCWGWISTNLLPIGDGFVYQVNGVLSVSIAGTPQDIVIDGNAEFNALRQLGASRFVVTAGNSILRVGTNSVKPIQLRVRSIVDGDERVWDRELAGPLELVELGSGRFDLAHPYLEQFRAGGSVPTLPVMPGALRRVTEVKERDERGQPVLCTEEAERRLELGPLLALGQRLQQSGGIGDMLQKVWQ